MKNKKHLWIPILVAVSLCALLFIQIQWLITSAELQEKHFQERTNLALCNALKELSTDRNLCSALSTCTIKKEAGLVELIGIHNSQQIEKVIARHLEAYNILIPYSISIHSRRRDLNSDLEFTQAKFENVEDAFVQLDFPSKNEFILGELKGMFALSFVLILALIALSVLAMIWFIRQNQVRMQTIHYVESMSHELKTPVNNISLSLALFDKNLTEKLPLKLRSYLDVAKSENELLKERINAKMGAESLDRVLKNKNVDKLRINDILTEAIAKFKVQLEDVNGKINLEIDKDELFLLGNEKELMNVFICLIDNAIRYCNSSPDIRISLKESEDKVLINIADNGIGIGEAHIDKIFERHYRNTSDADGHGLGLYFVKKIINEHGGDIELEGQEGEGSTFIIQLPKAQ